MSNHIVSSICRYLRQRQFRKDAKALRRKYATSSTGWPFVAQCAYGHYFEFDRVFDQPSMWPSHLTQCTCCRYLLHFLHEENTVYHDNDNWKEEYLRENPPPPNLPPLELYQRH